MQYIFSLLLLVRSLCQHGKCIVLVGGCYFWTSKLCLFLAAIMNLFAQVYWSERLRVHTRMHHLRPPQNWSLSWLAGGPPAGGSISGHLWPVLQSSGGEHHHRPHITGPHRDLQVSACRTVPRGVRQSVDLPRYLRA